MRRGVVLGLLALVCACSKTEGGGDSGAGGASGIGGPVFGPQAGASGAAGTGGASGMGGMGGAAGVDMNGAGGMDMNGAGGMDMNGTGGTMMSGDPVDSVDACTPPTALFAVTDFGAPGPFEWERILNTGPGGGYTIVRPKTLGTGGFKHPLISWGNGILTTPDAYEIVFQTLASHGFVVIGSNSTMVTSTLVRQGLDWLIEQNSAAGPLQGQLAVDCAVTAGYSLGGGAAVDAGSHPNVKAVASLHGLQGAAENASGPLLLLTSTEDGFVTKAGYTVPTYNRSSSVPTVMGTLDTGKPASNEGHYIPLNDAGPERAPLVAWLRYWIYGDQGARDWFFGSGCTLCTAPWVDIQRKNHTWD